MELWQFFGQSHPRLVQLPLVLLPAGLLFDLCGGIRGSSRARWAGKALMLAGTVFLLLAFICGIYAEIWAARAGVPQDPIEWHEFVANLATWGFVVLAAWRLLLDEERRRTLVTYALLGLGYYCLLLLTAYLGGQLVFSYGAGVTGARADTVLSLHDLNALATRQTDANLRYSEMVHHSFGWMTLALGGSLLLQAVWPARAKWFRWLAPLLLLAGGLYLALFSDLDLYRWTDLRKFRDREVQFHKLLGLTMATVGAIGLRRSLGPGKPGHDNRMRHEPQPRQAPPDPGAGAPEGAAPPPGGSYASRLTAVMALIGGGLLFTHVHTVAPYANVAAGVYISHVVMGLVALSVGGARLAQDWLPRYRRGFGIAFGGLLVVESVLLVTYTEGLPWFIGYGRYNQWGQPGSTIAPYGPIRAELAFDTQTTHMDVYVRDRFAETPAPIPATALHLLVARGYQEIAVALQPVASTPDGRAWHFTGQAPFLKDVLAFGARLALPVNGRMKMGYFDPWVVPAITPVPPNEVARFQCPMHPGIRAREPGSCSLCGMPLEPIQRNPLQSLHDTGYDMVLVTTPQLPVPGRATWLKFTPRHNGLLLRDLAVVHEHLLHLIIVSADLGYFAHVHPEPQPDGSFVLPYTFPVAGQYLLFADITPKGRRSQVFRLPLAVGSNAGATSNAPLALSPALSKPVGEYLVQLIPQPRTPVAGIHTLLLFRLWRHGQPVTDLEPYIGAMGHCVILSADTQTYLHSHPEMLYPPGPNDRAGPDIAFHALFLKPGRYKVWGQFKRGSEIIVADFVLDVEAPLLPQRVMRLLFEQE